MRQLNLKSERKLSSKFFDISCRLFSLFPWSQKSHACISVCTFLSYNHAICGYKWASVFVKSTTITHRQFPFDFFYLPFMWGKKDWPFGRDKEKRRYLMALWELIKNLITFRSEYLIFITSNFSSLKKTSQIKKTVLFLVLFLQNSRVSHRYA